MWGPPSHWVPLDFLSFRLVHTDNQFLPLQVFIPRHWFHRGVSLWASAPVSCISLHSPVSVFGDSSLPCDPSSLRESKESCWFFSSAPHLLGQSGNFQTSSVNRKLEIWITFLKGSSESKLRAVGRNTESDISALPNDKGSMIKLAINKANLHILYNTYLGSILTKTWLCGEGQYRAPLSGSCFSFSVHRGFLWQHVSLLPPLVPACVGWICHFLSKTFPSKFLVLTFANARDSLPCVYICIVSLWVSAFCSSLPKANTLNPTSHPCVSIFVLQNIQHSGRWVSGRVMVHLLWQDELLCPEHWADRWILGG